MIQKGIISISNTSNISNTGNTDNSAGLLLTRPLVPYPPLLQRELCSLQQFKFTFQKRTEPWRAELPAQTAPKMQVFQAVF
jgi:hypothetical protein